ncbi:MAG: hypothetical protein DRG71_07285 [Deltaproteobacteria bacterium]|nr:MAG: hypothetical protein DRG71_07285 [Deltaproteobacteria bacterium]
MSFFFPVIMAMGGNTGQQAAIIVVRGLATGDISLMKTGRRLLTEFKVALGNGIICGTLLGLIVGTWLSNYELGAVVAVALLAVMINAGLIGSAIPLAFKKIGVDPALATGPFVSTSNDIFGLLIYLVFVTTYLKMSA